MEVGGEQLNSILRPHSGVISIRTLTNYITLTTYLHRWKRSPIGGPCGSHLDPERAPCNERVDLSLGLLFQTRPVPSWLCAHTKVAGERDPGHADERERSRGSNHASSGSASRYLPRLLHRPLPVSFPQRPSVQYVGTRARTTPRHSAKQLIPELAPLFGGTAEWRLFEHAAPENHQAPGKSQRRGLHVETTALPLGSE